MSTKCTVQFDHNPNGIYYAGQQISGTAELITSRPKTIRSIHITVNGYAEVRWTETIQKANPDGKTENIDAPFTAIEQYITNQTFVYGQSAGDSINLPAGKYLYPFQSFIPTNCPTTLNGQYGKIRYEVIVTIDRPLRYDNVFKQPFTVISPLDLNLNQIYSNPIEKSEEKKFTCNLCCGNNDPIVVQVTISYNGYAPGQKIHFQISVDNKSNVNCSEIKLKLMKNEKFTCRTPSTKVRENSTKICDKKLDSIPKQEKKIFKDFLQIPSTTPSTLKTCSIIEVQYVLNIVTKVSGLHTNIHMPIPITIGTVPLQKSAFNGEDIVTSQPGGQQFTPIAAPSYEDDVNRTKMFQNNDVNNKFMVNVDYVPKYPVFYNFGSAGSNNATNNVMPTTNPSLYPSTTPYPYPNPSANQYPSPNNPSPYTSPTTIQNQPQMPTSPPYPNEPQGVIWSSPPSNTTTNNSVGWKH